MVEKNSNHPSSPLLTGHEGLGVVVFKLDDQEYGLRLEDVAEIFRMVAITPIPKPENGVEGIINLRGKIVPLLDLRKCLGFAARPYTLSTHIVIAQADGHTIGLLVDCVTRVATISGGNIKQQGVAPHSKHLLGVAKTDDSLLLMLDIISILKQMANGAREKIYSQASRRTSQPVPELVKV